MVRSKVEQENPNPRWEKQIPRQPNDPSTLSFKNYQNPKASPKAFTKRKKTKTARAVCEEEEKKWRSQWDQRGWRGFVQFVEIW